MARGVLHIPVKLYASRQPEPVELSKVYYGCPFISFLRASSSDISDLFPGSSPSVVRLVNEIRRKVGNACMNL